jgi:hypothetical protein
MTRVVGFTALTILVLSVSLSARIWRDSETAAAPPAQTIAYHAGWANIAWTGPTLPIAQALGPVLANVGMIYYLDHDTSQWLRYVPNRPELTDFTTMAFDEAYLILWTGPATLEATPEEMLYGAPPWVCLPFLIDTPSGECQDIDEVCDLIHDVKWQYDLTVPMLDQYDLEWLQLTFAIEDLDRWERYNC